MGGSWFPNGWVARVGRNRTETILRNSRLAQERSETSCTCSNEKLKATLSEESKPTRPHGPENSEVHDVRGHVGR